MKISAVTFTANEDKRKDAEKKAVTGGGAIAATTAATRGKAARSDFDMFASSKKLANGMQTVTQTAKNAKTVAKKSMTLWGKVCENAKWAKKAVMNWGTKFKSLKYIRPLVESKIFRGCAGVLGYGFGIVTLISGISNIAKIATNATNGQLLKKK